MKILIATGIYPPDIGGPATYAALLAEQLPKRGIKVDVLSFGIVRKYPKIFRHIVYFSKVLIRSIFVDIVFTQDPVSTGIPVILASFFTRKKFILRVAGDYAWEQSCQRFGVKDGIDDFQNKKYNFRTEILRFLQRFTVRHVDTVITPSKYFNNLVSAWNNNKVKIITIYNGISIDKDLKLFPVELIKTNKTIISAGRLVSWKGFDVLIECLPRLSGWNLEIAGDGPDKLRLQDLIKKMSLETRVVLLGNIPRNDLLCKISKSQIFALLSTFESFSFQIVEAMHVGAPVIAGDIGNISEIIDNGKDGILINPVNKDAFVKSVQHLETDSQFRESIIKNAHIKALEFSFEKTLDKLVVVFNNCLS